MLTRFTFVHSLTFRLIRITPPISSNQSRLSVRARPVTSAPARLLKSPDAKPRNENGAGEPARWPRVSPALTGRHHSGARVKPQALVYVAGGHTKPHARAHLRAKVSPCCTSAALNLGLAPGNLDLAGGFTLTPKLLLTWDPLRSPTHLSQRVRLTGITPGVGVVGPGDGGWLWDVQDYKGQLKERLPPTGRCSSQSLCRGCSSQSLCRGFSPCSFLLATP